MYSRYVAIFVFQYVHYVELWKNVVLEHYLNVLIENVYGIARSRPTQ